MQLEQTDTFQKDVTQLDKAVKQQLKQAIEKIISNPQKGKPMRHARDVFSQRVGNRRLIYALWSGKLLFVCFKAREEVYEYLKKIL